MYVVPYIFIHSSLFGFVKIFKYKLSTYRRLVTNRKIKIKQKTHVKRERARGFYDASSPKPLFIDRGDRILHIYTRILVFSYTI